MRIGAVIWASFPCSRWLAIKTFLVLRMSVCVLWWTYTITKERCWYYTWEIWGHLRVLYFLGDRHKQDERYSEVSLVVSKYMWQQVCECRKEERVFLEVGRILKDTRSGWFYVDLGKASYFCFFLSREAWKHTEASLIQGQLNLRRKFQQPKSQANHWGSDKQNSH